MSFKTVNTLKIDMKIIVVYKVKSCINLSQKHTTKTHTCTTVTSL